MLIDTRASGISGTLATVGSREEDQVQLLRQVVEPGMTVLDIGANTGSYTLLLASLLQESGQVHAFEPAPENFDTLRRTIELNALAPLVRLNQAALSDHSGQGTLHMHNHSNLHTLHATKFHDFTTQQAFVSTRSVDLVSIGGFLLEYDPVHLIRMDIEGHEVEILNGLAEVSNRLTHLPAVLFENHFPKYDDKQHSMRTPLRHLFELGYRVKVLTSTDESKTRISELGYRARTTVKTDRVTRGLYYGLSNSDAETLICDIGTIRATLLSCDPPTQAAG